MSFPTSPTNGQQATVNGITYTYSTTYGTWTRVPSDIGQASATANAAFIKANSAGSFANGSFAHANAAFNQANTSGTDAWVRTQANNAFDTANAAFNQANNSTDSWVRTQANNAYNTANSAGSFANGSFVVANSAASFANGSFVTANSGASFANAAFVHANAAFNAANTGGGGSSVDTYISLTMTGVITVPYTGTSRFYPPRAMTLSTVYANLSTAASGGNFTFIIKKNGTSIGNTFTIIQNQTVMTSANISVSLATTDYLTLDVNGASATDLFVRIKYTNT
jgi:hypothetical protein